MDLTYSAALPVHRPEATLLYGASGSHVRNAWIAGQHVLIDGKPTTLDEAAIHARASRWSTRLAALRMMSRLATKSTRTRDAS